MLGRDGRLDRLARCKEKKWKREGEENIRKSESWPYATPLLFRRSRDCIPILTTHLNFVYFLLETGLVKYCDLSNAVNILVHLLFCIPSIAHYLFTIIWIQISGS